MARKEVPMRQAEPRSSFLISAVVITSLLGACCCSFPFILYLRTYRTITPSVEKHHHEYNPPSPSNFSRVSFGTVPKLNPIRVRNITLNDAAIVYLQPINTIITNHAKSGSTAVYGFLYHALFGKPYNRTYCATYIQNINGHCWKRKARFLYRLPLDEQLRLLTSNDTLRVAIQRDPYARMLSAFKSKFTCDRKLFHSDPPKEYMFRVLHQNAGLPPKNQSCISIEEYADCLSAMRNRLLQKRIHFKQIEVHTRPQRFFFDEIQYDLVLDIKEAVGKESILPLWERFPYRDKVPDGIVTFHTSSAAKLIVPEEAERKIRLYASLSETRERPGNQIFPKNETA